MLAPPLMGPPFPRVPLIYSGGVGRHGIHTDDYSSDPHLYMTQLDVITICALTEHRCSLSNSVCNRSGNDEGCSGVALWIADCTYLLVMCCKLQGCSNVVCLART